MCLDMLLKESATETFVPWSWSDNSLNANTDINTARYQDTTSFQQGILMIFILNMLM